MCGCRNKTNLAAARQANGSGNLTSTAQVQSRSTGTVPLGLCTSVNLPARFKGAWDGADVVVLLNKSQKPFGGGAINIMGRNAPVSPKIKAALEEKWPKSFCTA